MFCSKLCQRPLTCSYNTQSFTWILRGGCRVFFEKPTMPRAETAKALDLVSRGVSSMVKVLQVWANNGVAIRKITFKLRQKRCSWNEKNKFVVEEVIRDIKRETFTVWKSVYYNNNNYYCLKGFSREGHLREEKKYYLICVSNRVPYIMKVKICNQRKL